MASRSFTRFVKKQLRRFPRFLLCMVLEWVLIFTLFLDGFLAIFANEFAKHFDLKIPCWLCTRMNHVLALKTPHFYYNDSICEAHKKEVSCLGFCHNHKKLSDIRKMCESCLLSFAIEKDSNLDAYKSLVGILHKDLECFEDCQKVQVSLKDDEVMRVEKSGTQRCCSCSCCGEPLKAKSPLSKRKNSQLKFMLETDSEHPQNVDGNNTKYQNIKLREEAKGLSLPLLTEGENSDNTFSKIPTPTFTRGNRFIGNPLTDSQSPNMSPRWSYGIKRKSSLKKAGSACDLNELNRQKEVDSAILQNLERRVSLDGESLMALYMDLDEERSASAVAANNAMAMITRLQEEKAALQMDALQYQRMMEEQLEYDDEAIQTSNDMVLKLEEEVEALETELEIYRAKYGGLTEDDFKEIDSSHGSHSSLPNIIEGKDNGEKDLNCHQDISYRADNGGVKLNESLKDFKMEKTYLLGRTKKAENRIPLAESGIYSLQYSSDNVNNVDSETGKGSEASLPRQLFFLTERMKALETDNGFLDIVSKEDEKYSEGTKILDEISKNLEKLWHLVMLPFEVNNA
ncbi:hypothetical protein TanjilG_31511 [Lupinus angustifolius]|uniref:GTD-binding domain-containing protein n=1 Tax=Lupinus angustifolius TaxID=3871 RepID=A0A4P1RUE5_LUPAN|nr:PREDICTED: probable myosin-binding protein 5 [Lupinus angustifolius]OIW18371.1 hypothetical protein TanjilG_31511 [Lupinus angustifolius]